MKANELMVGDWVCLPSIMSDDKFPVQVLEIRDDYIKYYVGGKKMMVRFKDIEPIPLTQEILEKNGFEKTQIHGEKQDDIFQCFDGEVIIEVGIYDPNFIFTHYRYETPDGINSGELSSIVKADGGKFYLHELQHALRLCGIEKEIIL